MVIAIDFISFPRKGPQATLSSSRPENAGPGLASLSLFIIARNRGIFIRERKGNELNVYNAKVLENDLQQVIHIILSSVPDGSGSR